MRKGLLFLTGLIFLGACTIVRTNYIVEYDKVPQTKNQNVCKFMDDSLLVYAIFVDVDIYHPWTEFDVRSTMDSLQKATQWLESQGVKYNKKVHFDIIRHEQSNKWTIYERRAKTSLSLNGLKANIPKKNMRKLNPWADAIAAYAGRGIKYSPLGKIAKRLKINNKENLVLALRDKFK